MRKTWACFVISKVSKDAPKWHFFNFSTCPAYQLHFKSILCHVYDLDSIMTVKDLNWRQDFIYWHFMDMAADHRIHVVIDVSIVIEAENFTKIIFIILSNRLSAQNIKNAWLRHQWNEKRHWVSCKLSNVSFLPEGPTIRPIWRRVLHTMLFCENTWLIFWSSFH